jgi:Cu/Zn superoxide dismutase
MDMRKLTALLAMAALAFVPAGALAAKPKPKDKKPSPRAKVYKATIKAVGADAAYTTKRFGKAQLVDGKKNNKVSVHVRGLTPGGTYLWHVHQATGPGNPCEDPAIAGPPYAGWDWTKVDPFTANAAGHYNKTFKTKTFPISIAQGDTGFVYYVNIHFADGTVFACGVFKGSRKATPKFKKQQAAKKKQQHRGHRP